MKKKLLYPGLVIILFIIGFLIARMGNEDSRLIKRSRLLLGTFVEIQIKNFDKEKCEHAIDAAFIEIDRIENLFSTYKESSPVWKINNSRDSLFEVDEEIYQVMQMADSVYRLSGSVFDISLENINKAWGFDTEEPKLPSEAEIKSALKKSGWDNISLKGKNTFIRNNETGLNFGAIAKGYAVVRAIIVIKDLGIESALVNAGGDVRTIGDDWVVGIQHPRDQGMVERVKLNNRSIATSGDYEKFYKINGQRYHHILDPATGYPADSVMSVTVISANCALADALATAVFVMGVESGLELIEKLPDTEVMIVDKKGDRHYSSGLSNFILE